MLGIEKLFGGSPGHQGTLAAIAQVLQASGPQRMPQSLYGILGGGLMAGQQVAQQAREQEMVGQLRQQQFEGGQLELQDRKSARDLQQQINAAARDSYRTAGQQASSLPGGPTVANAARIGEFKDGIDVDTLISKVMAINPMEGMKLAQSLKKAGPKFDAGITWVNGPDGKPMAVRTADDGSFKALDGLAPREKLHFLNTGGKTLGVNEFSGEQGVAFTNSMSPDAVAADRRAAQGNALKAQEIAMGGKPPPGYRWAEGGTLAAIPGGPGDKLPESQQKQLVGVNNVKSAIAEYRESLKSFGGIDALNPDARAMMGTKYNNMMLQAKEAYNLGVLNGPDLDILQSVITDPRSVKGAFVSKKALDTQASELDRMMTGMGDVSSMARQPQQAGGGRQPPASTGAKVATMADIAETARKSGRSTAEVTAALRAKGYTIGGQ